MTTTTTSVTGGEKDFHEKQRAKDCSIHSLNNALGRKVLLPSDVVEEINKRVEGFAEAFGLPKTDKKVRRYRKSLSDGKTFFSAESVWYAAAAKGQTCLPRRLEYTGSITPEMAAAKGLIILGVGLDGAYHAVGARDGRIYDSLNEEGSVGLTDENVKKIYSEVLGVFVLP